MHDAYIESAELLTKKDPLGAVDMYCRFPVSATPNFDDAYIFGEIVRLLLKNEKYDDPRLVPNMVSWGKVMGLGKNCDCLLFMTILRIFVEVVIRSFGKYVVICGYM